MMNLEEWIRDYADTRCEKEIIDEIFDHRIWNVEIIQSIVSNLHCSCLFEDDEENRYRLVIDGANTRLIEILKVAA